MGFFFDLQDRPALELNPASGCAVVQLLQCYLIGVLCFKRRCCFARRERRCRLQDSDTEIAQAVLQI